MNQLAFLILFLFIQSLGCGNGQVTVLQLQVNLFFLKARQINRKLIAIVILLKPLNGKSIQSSNKLSPKILGNISHASLL